MPRITECRAIDNSRVWLRFDDGAEGTVDLARLRGRGVFAAWDDPAVFAQARIDPETGTVCGPGGIDLDPYVLHSEITGAPLPGSHAARSRS